MQIPWDHQGRCSLEVMSPYYGQGEGVSRVHKVHIGHLLNLLFICMCNAGMCAYVGVCHAMSPLVGDVCIWGVCMGMCACVGVCHAMSVFAAAKLPNDLGGGRTDRKRTRLNSSH